MGKSTFELTAIVLLPNHLHAVWELPLGVTDDSTRWRLAKSLFTRLWQESGGSEGVVTGNRHRKRERGL